MQSYSNVCDHTISKEEVYRTVHPCKWTTDMPLKELQTVVHAQTVRLNPLHFSNIIPPDPPPPLGSQC